LRDVVDRLCEGQRAALRKYRREIAPFEVLHGDVGTAVLRPGDVEHSDDVLIAELECGARLAHESCGRLLVVAPAQLHRDALAQQRMRGLDHTSQAPGADDRAHEKLVGYDLADTRHMLLHIAAFTRWYRSVIVMSEPVARDVGLAWYAPLRGGGQ